MDSWEEMDVWLRAKGIRVGNPAPSRALLLSQTYGGGHVAGSWHYSHEARDYDPYCNDANAIARALEPFARGPNYVIAELLWSPLGIWYDNGHFFRPASKDIEYRNHFSHCHAAKPRGRHLPTGGSPIPVPPEEDDLTGPEHKLLQECHDGLQNVQTWWPEQEKRIKAIEKSQGDQNAALLKIIEHFKIPT